MEDIKKILRQIGLTENEMNIYIELLKVGSAPASLLGKKTGLPRTTAKFTCEQLYSKKIINGVQKANAVIYSIDSPEKLIFLLEQQEQNIKSNRSELNRLMGEMKSLLNPKAVLPKIKFFEGEEGLIRTYEDILETVKKNSEILAYTKLYEDLDAFPKLEKAIKSYNEAREKKKVYEKVIQVQSTKKEKKVPYDKKYREHIMLDSEPADFNGAQIYIYEDTIWHVSIKDDVIFGYKVKNEIFAFMYRMMFNFLWNNHK